MLQVASAKPLKSESKQSPDTKKAASLFGKTSALSKSLRDLCSHYINGFYDGPMVERLVSEVQPVIKAAFNKQQSSYHFSGNSFERLSRFDFNELSPLRNSLLSLPTFSLVADQLTVTFPELENHRELKFHKDSNSCVIYINVGCYNLEHGFAVPLELNAKIQVQAKEAIIERQEFVFTLPQECLCLSTVVIHYYQDLYKMPTLVNSKTFNPAGICSAIVTSGTFDGPYLRETLHYAKAAFGKSEYTGLDYPKHLIQEEKDNIQQKKIISWER